MLKDYHKSEKNGDSNKSNDRWSKLHYMTVIINWSVLNLSWGGSVLNNKKDKSTDYKIW